MHRFFLPPELFNSEIICLSAEISHQITRVLRLKPGQDIILLDNQGFEYGATLITIDNGTVFAKILSKNPVSSESSVKTTLFLALTQREKFEWSLQKCTELGASAFVPVITSRTLVQERQYSERKIIRWQHIIREAAEQSRRGRLPEISHPLTLEKIINSAIGNHDLLLIPWEEEHSMSLKKVLFSKEVYTKVGVSIGILIGPEGGFSAKEVDKAAERGFIPISLGKRILRMETAAMATLTMVLYELGEMGE